MSQRVSSQLLKPGDVVLHPKRPDWGQGTVIQASGGKAEIRFNDGSVRLFGSDISLTLLEENAVTGPTQRVSCPQVTEEVLWQAVIRALEDEKGRCLRRGKTDLIIETVEDGIPNLIMLRQDAIIRRSKQKSGPWGKPQTISKDRFWKLAELAIQKGEHQLKDSPPGGYNGCIICAILDMLPWFECRGASAGKLQRIVFLG